MNVKEPLRRVNLTAMASILALSLLTPAGRAQEAAPKIETPQVTDAKVAGQDVPVPTRKRYVAPEYPSAAATQGIRGIVILEVVIGEDGRVLNARVTRSIPGLDEAAIAAVRLWEYEPSQVSGKPVKVVLSQSITFALKLPDLRRAPGVPELKSGGAPPSPSGLSTPEHASVEVTLGSQGEVKEASVLEGNSVLSEALMRAVKSWRFVVSEGSTPPSFTVRAEWTPGPQSTLALLAVDLKTGTATAAASPPNTAAPGTAPAASPPSPASAAIPAAPLIAATSPPPPAAPLAAAAAPTTALASTPGAKAAEAPSSPGAPASSPSPAVDTDVLPARPEPPAKEQGISAVADVMLGENIPDLAKGRRPIWPPLARLGSITGDVEVRFSVDLAGKATVHSAEGPEMLKDGAAQAVSTWLFRRTAIDRLRLIATFKFGNDRALAKVERQP